MTATKIQPGDDTHLTLLMAPHSLNFLTGADRAALLAFGRDVFAAALDSKCLAQIEEPAGAAPAAVAPQGVVAWMHPETLDVIHADRKHEWATRYGIGGHSRAEGYTVALVRAGEPAAASPALEAPESHTQALRAIADWPVTDMLMNMDAANMRGIAQRALAAAPQAPAAPSGEVISANCEFATVRWLHQTSGKGGGDPKNSYSWPITGEKVFLAASAAPSTHAGLLAAAAHIQAKAQAHLDERGSYDPDTGAVEMSDANQEHFNTLDELADEIRMMADKAAPASCDRPPAGWTCTRAPGHDGPCAAAPAAPAVDAQGERDAAFEAVRNRLCSLQRYSFVLDDDGIVRRAHDRTGSWIEFDDAHALFDPVAVDAAIAAQAKEGGEAC
ncbi:hypothetical protein ABEW79_17950 [Delftia tsuruhatensis]|uniref:hypothetical protein n=1 Tax=Delftia tsuruhatensis TaxID=180282 RepID=UPI003D21AFC6